MARVPSTAEWQTIVQDVYSEAGVCSLSADTVRKRATKAARDFGYAGSKTERGAAFEHFLHLATARSELRTEGARLVLPQRAGAPGKGSERKAADESHEAPAAAASPQPAKRAKHAAPHSEEPACQQHAAASSAAAGAASFERGHKKQKRKARTLEGADTQGTGSHSSQQQAAQPPSSAPAASPVSTQPEAAAKPQKKKKRKPGSEAAGQPATPTVASDSAAVSGSDSASPAAKKQRQRLQAGADALAGMPQLPWREDQKRHNVKHGRFTKAEKETLRAAITAYAKEHSLSMDDMSWLFATRKGDFKGQTKGAWRAIAAALPQRNAKSCYSCGTRMFHEHNYQGRWTEDEDATLLALVSERGRRWTEIGALVGRMPESCRDRWKDIRHTGARRTGRWDAAETERLRAAVADYLAARQADGGGAAEATLSLDDIAGAAPASPSDSAPDDEPPDGRIILDDIDWEVISDRVGTRSNIQCMHKWYSQLSPSMVATGEWGSGDDRRMLRALLAAGASRECEVAWGELVAGRAAQAARRRWRLMLKHVPDAADKEFDEVLDYLVTTYTPDLKARFAAGQLQ